MDGESYYGSILLGMGSNHFRLMGGKNECSAHIDYCLRNHSFWVDDLLEVDNETIVAEGLK